MSNEEIFQAACNLINEAYTSNFNFSNDDPSVSIQDVAKMVIRLRKANEWCKTHGYGNQFKTIASSRKHTSNVDFNINAEEIFDGVFNGTGIYGNV